MKVLAVNVEQHLTERLQLIDGDDVAVDVGARAAVRVDDAAQEASVVFVKRL